MKKKLLITKIFLVALSLCAFITGLCTINSAKNPKGVWAGDNLAWDNASLLPTTSGSYVLQTDVVLSAVWEIEAQNSIVLDLNGKTVEFSSSSITKMVANEGNLTIKDSSVEQTGAINLTLSKSSSTVYAFSVQNGTLNLESGKINISRTAGTSTVYGIYSGVINMTGGEVNVNSSTATTVNAISSSGNISGGKVSVSAKTTANVCSNATTRITGGDFVGTTVSAKVLGGTFNFEPQLPNYYVSTLDGAGNYTVSVDNTVGYLVELDGTQYVELEQALMNLKQTSTIKLLKNYDLLTNKIIVPSGVNLTFDLNGKTLSCSGAKVIDVAGSLTIIDSVGEASIDHAYSGTSKTYTIEITSTEGQFTLNSGTINTNYNGTTNNLYVISVFSDKKGPITINGGVINTNHNHLTASYGYAYGARATNTTLIMTGGEINAFCAKQVYGIAFGGNNSQMTGGTIIATSSTGAPIGVSGEGTIFGGTIKAIAQDAEKNANVANSSSAVILDGNFEGNSVSARVLGGTFNFNPTSVNADVPTYTHCVVDNKNGTWSIALVPQEDLPENIDVDGKHFATFDLAKDAIVVGSRITLLENYIGNKTAISIPGGITLDLNGKTITLDKSVALNIAGGTVENPTLITDTSATSHDNAGVIKALVKVGDGYTNIEKVNVDTTEIEKFSSINISGTSSSKAIVSVKGIKLNTAPNESNTSYGDFYFNLADLTVDNLNSDFPLVVNSAYKFNSTSYYHTVFYGKSDTNLVINGGYFTTTEENANHDVRLVHNNNLSAVSHIKGGEFTFNNGSANVKTLYATYCYTANDSDVSGGKFFVPESAQFTGAKSGRPIITGGIYNVEPSAEAIKEGYAVIANPDASTSDVYPYYVKLEPQVKVGDKEYDGIQLAINAMNDGAESGREITLLRDVSLGAALVVKIDGITINKGDYSLKFTESGVALTIYDGVETINGIDEEIASLEAYRALKGGKNYYRYFSDAAESAGNITLLKDITLADGVSFNYYTNTPCVINLGKYTITSQLSASTTALFLVRGSTTTQGNLTINAEEGGGIDVNNTYVFHVGAGNKGNLIINGGSFIGRLTCVNMQNGTLTVNDGAFKINTITNPESPYYNNYGYTINCIDENRQLCDVVINGGKFYKFNPADNASEGAGTNYVSNLVYCVYYEQDTEYYVAKTEHVDQEQDGACDNCGLEQIIIETFNGYDGVFDNFTHQVGVVATHSLSQTYGINYAIYRCVESEWVILQDYSNLFTVKNVIDSGSYKIVASIKCGYLYTSVEQEFTVDITPLNVEDATITLGENLIYNEQEQTQVVNSVVINGIQLIADTDYYITNNTAINVASSNYVLGVHGMGNYSGIAYKNWNISKANANIEVDTTPIQKTYGEVWNLPVATTNFGVVVCDTLVNEVVNAGTYIITYSVEGNSNYNGDSKTVHVVINKIKVEKPVADTTVFNYTGEEQTYVVAQDSRYTVSDCNMTNAGSKDITISLIDTANYEWTDETIANVVYTFTISKANANIEVDTAPIQKTYGEVWNLPIATTNFGVVVCDTLVNEVVNAGEYVVKYEVLGTDNYFGDVKTISITINKATYDMSEILFEDKVYIQDGLEHSVQISGNLPSGVSVAYLNNNKTEAGVYNVIATFIYDTLNYNEIQPMTATLVINKSQITANDGNNEGGEQQTPSVIVLAQNGFNPNVEVVFTKVDPKDVDAGDVIKDGEEIFAVYDVSLIKDGASIQPDGTITIKLLIPEELQERDYKIIHNHNGEFSQVEYEVVDGYAVFNVDKLSEFMFVYTPVVFPWYVLAFWGLCFICMTIALIAVNKKN